VGFKGVFTHIFLLVILNITTQYKSLSLMYQNKKFYSFLIIFKAFLTFLM